MRKLTPPIAQKPAAVARRLAPSAHPLGHSFPCPFLFVYPQCSPNKFLLTTGMLTSLCLHPGSCFSFAANSVRALLAPCAHLSTQTLPRPLSEQRPDGAPQRKLCNRQPSIRLLCNYLSQSATLVGRLLVKGGGPGVHAAVAVVRCRCSRCAAAAAGKRRYPALQVLAATSSLRQAGSICHQRIPYGHARLS